MKKKDKKDMKKIMLKLKLKLDSSEDTSPYFNTKYKLSSTSLKEDKGVSTEGLDLKK